MLATLTIQVNLMLAKTTGRHPSPTSVGGHLEDKFCELVGDYYLEQYPVLPIVMVINLIYCSATTLKLL
jgi:hypothetical protein